MNYLKKIFEGYPSDKEIAQAIVKYKTKYPDRDYMLRSIKGYLNIPIENMGDYDFVYNRIVNPVVKHGSGLVKSDFISNYYHKIKQDISEDIDLIEDAFLDIDYKFKIVSDSLDHNAYCVVIYQVSSKDIPEVTKKLINTISQRMPKNYILRSFECKFTLSGIRDGKASLGSIEVKIVNYELFKKNI